MTRSQTHYFAEPAKMLKGKANIIEIIAFLFQRRHLWHCSAILASHDAVGGGGWQPGKFLRNLEMQKLGELKNSLHKMGWVLVY